MPPESGARGRHLASRGEASYPIPDWQGGIISIFTAAAIFYNIWLCHMEVGATQGALRDAIVTPGCHCHSGMPLTLRDAIVAPGCH